MKKMTMMATYSKSEMATYSKSESIRRYKRGARSFTFFPYYSKSESIKQVISFSHFLVHITSTSPQISEHITWFLTQTHFRNRFSFTRFWFWFHFFRFSLIWYLIYLSESEARNQNSEGPNFPFTRNSEAKNPEGPNSGSLSLKSESFSPFQVL